MHLLRPGTIWEVGIRSLENSLHELQIEIHQELPTEEAIFIFDTEDLYLIYCRQTSKCGWNGRLIFLIYHLNTLGSDQEIQKE